MRQLTEASERPVRHLGRTLLGVGAFVALMLWLAVPGYAATLELGYADYTANVSTISSDTANPTTIVTAPSIDVDGATVALIDFYVPSITCTNAGSCLWFYLYDNGSKVGRIGYGGSASGDYSSTYTARRIIPASGSHVFSIRAAQSGGTAVVGAGTGAGEANPPGFIRVTRSNPELLQAADYYTKTASDARYAAAGSSCGGLGEDPCQVAGAFGLSEGDRERLDLAWWGTWAIVGLLFVLILAPRWFRSFGVTQGG